jgi:hypothetical protein
MEMARKNIFEHSIGNHTQAGGAMLTKKEIAAAKTATYFGVYGWGEYRPGKKSLW